MPRGRPEGFDHRPFQRPHLLLEERQALEGERELLPEPMLGARQAQRGPGGVQELGVGRRHQMPPARGVQHAEHPGAGGAEQVLRRGECPEQR